ncbi:hypothetical protein [Piscirickettsia salmonis]|nr:hypothetical protein [Piscirickettsia salmonis]
MLGDFASLDVQNTYRGSDAYVLIEFLWNIIAYLKKPKILVVRLF